MTENMVRTQVYLPQATYKALIERAEKQGLTMATQIRAALDGRDADSLRRAAHGFKGAAANFGATALVNAARALEEIGHRGEFAGQEQVWNTLISETERLTATLRGYTKH